MNNINVVVKKDFLDRCTGKMNKAGDKLTIREDRYREILRSGDFVEVAKKEAKKSVKKESK